MDVLEMLPHGLWVAFAISLGLVVGSFLNVVIHRLPRGMNVAFPASSCPKCHAPIRIRDNVPVLGWLLLAGKARCCGAKISPRYPLVELLGGGLSWAIFEVLVATLPGGTPTWKFAALFACFLLLCFGLLAALFIDLEHMILPDEITLGGTALGLLTVPLREISWSEALLGGAAGFLIVWLPFIFIYQKLRGVPGMGLGDAKLLMLGGVWFGWPGALFALLAGAVQGTAVAIAVFVAAGKIDEPEAVVEERKEFQRQLAAMPESERADFARELADDPLLSEPDEGLGGARLAFGPFLIVALLEFFFLGEWLIGKYLMLLEVA